MVQKGALNAIRRHGRPGVNRAIRSRWHQSEQQWRFLMPHCLARPELALAAPRRVCFPINSSAISVLCYDLEQTEHHLH